MAFSNPANSITLPGGASISQPRIVIGGDVPPELQAIGYETAIIFYLYDINGNYSGYVFCGFLNASGSEETAVVWGINPFKSGSLQGATSHLVFLPGTDTTSEECVVWACYLLSCKFPNAPLYPFTVNSGTADERLYTYTDGGGWNNNAVNGSFEGVDRTTNGLKFTNGGVETDYPQLAFAGSEWPQRQYHFHGALWLNASSTSNSNNTLTLNIRKNTALTGTIVASCQLGPVVNTSTGTPIMFPFSSAYRPNPGSNPTSATNYFVSVKAVTNNIDIRSFPSTPNHVFMDDKGSFSV